MNIDKLLEEMKEENKKHPNSQVYEKCWNNILSSIEFKEKQNDKLSFKFYKLNKKYYFSKIAAAILVVAISASIPFGLEYGEKYINNKKSGIQNQNGKVASTKSDENKITDSDTAVNSENQVPKTNSSEASQDSDQRPEAKNLAEYYVKAYNAIEKIGESKYKKFSIYSNQELYYDVDAKKNYYMISLYEQRSDSVIPKAEQYYVYTDDFSTKLENSYGQDYNISENSIAILINKADNLGITDYSEIARDIGVSGNYTNSLPDKGKDIPDDSYMYKNNKNIYYTYDRNNGSLYKYDRKTSIKKQIYKLNLQEFSIAAIELKKDMDGDGKEDDIKFDPVRSVLSIDGSSIRTDSSCEFSQFDIVDIYKKDKHSEIYLKYNLDNDYKDNSYYIYKNGSISKILSSDGAPQIEADGKILFKGMISQFFSTHSKDEEYQYYKDDSFGKIEKDVYPENDGTNSGNIPTLKVKHDLKIYKSKDSTAVAATVHPGEEVKLLGTDEKNYVEIESASGIKGWFKFDKYTNKVEELNLDEADVFDNIVRAG
ncbi:hypothetical protein IAI10_12925 [Clostridium sp. 19966]|uniref:hypothetical protein n=1 Tax=Clostridium sp. 19966 TaxID=2768166 RepID=UPI0028DEBB10|nr:hypothetical protein [Clostridium sp. 19966]MDT8717568.1 hypothetical protein [Clostridium sp. 19966]